MTKKIAHIINPVKLPKDHELMLAQLVTFESMLRAKKQSTAEIELCTTQYAEDHSIIPEGFKILTDLGRSIQDLGEFKSGKKLPLIGDIIQKAIDETQADYVIYTNVDIAVMPQFYEAVASYLNDGHDALIINRRRIRPDLNQVADLPRIYSEVGKSHPGFDCFVIKRDLLEKFELGKIMVGIPFIGVALAHNIFAHAQDYLLLEKHHLTIHIGELVLPKRDRELYLFNRREFNQVYAKLKPELNSKKLPFAALPFWRRFLKYGLNPSTFIGPYTTMEVKGFWERTRYFFHELRFKLLDLL